MNYYINGNVAYLNCTPHPIRFKSKDGTEFTVPMSGLTLKADATNEFVSSALGVDFVTPVFSPSTEGRQEYYHASEWAEDMIDQGYQPVIIGSMISAQAYLGVRAIVPVPGTERSAPADKIFMAEKFSIFPLKPDPELLVREAVVKASLWDWDRMTHSEVTDTRNKIIRQVLYGEYDED